MISSLAAQSLGSCISSTRHHLIGTPRSRPLSRLPPMAQSLLQHALVLIRLWISVPHCATLVFLSEIRAMSLVTTRQLWTVLLSHMQSCTSVIMPCPFIEFVKPLPPSSSKCIILMGSSTLLTFSASIGHTHKFGTTLSLFSSFRVTRLNSMMRISFLWVGNVVCYLFYISVCWLLQDYKLMGSDRILGMTSCGDVVFFGSIRLTSL